MVGGAGGLYVQTGDTFVFSDIGRIDDVAYGDGLYCAVGDGIFTSEDKITWLRYDTEFGPFSKVVFADKFYIAANNYGVLSFDGRTLASELANPAEYVSATVYKNSYVFGTSEGDVVYSGEVTHVGDGQSYVAHTDTFTALQMHADTLSVYTADDPRSTVLTGETVLENLVLKDITSYSNKIVSVGSFVESPFFYIYNNGWTFVVSKLDAVPVAVYEGIVATEFDLYTTDDYLTFTHEHTFDNAISFVRKL